MIDETRFTTDGEFKNGAEFTCEEVEAWLRFRCLELAVQEATTTSEKRELMRARHHVNPARELLFAAQEGLLDGTAGFAVMPFVFFLTR